MKENFADIFDYLQWRGDLSFDESPFCAVDALVLCQLSYLNLKGLLSESFDERKTIAQIYQDFSNSKDGVCRLDMGAVLNERTPDLFWKASLTKRFSEVQICGYKAIYDEEKIEQFVAMTFILDKKNVAAVFQGTDDTFVGWHEDFNITFLENIPSQISGVEYLNKVGNHFRKNIIVAGHSKGGNVALYSSVFCNHNVCKQITEVYNFDGPGFDEAFFKTEQYLYQKNKIYSYYPHYSIVGMVFSHPVEFKIVDSSANKVFQHDAFSWNVLGNQFVFKDDFDDESKFFHVAFNDWMESLTKDDLKKFVKVFFDVVYSSGAKTNSELEANKLQASTRMFAEITKLDSESKSHVLKIVHLLLDVGKENIPMLNIFRFKGVLQDEIHKIEEAFDKYKEKLYERNDRD